MKISLWNFLSSGEGCSNEGSMSEIFQIFCPIYRFLHDTLVLLSHCNETKRKEKMKTDEE